MQLFIILCCSGFHSGFFLCFRRLSVYLSERFCHYLQSSCTAAWFGPNSQQADCFFSVVWLVLGIFLVYLFLICAHLSPLKWFHKGLKIYWVFDCHVYLDAAVRRNDQIPRQVWLTTELKLKYDTRIENNNLNAQSWPTRGWYEIK